MFISDTLKRSLLIVWILLAAVSLPAQSNVQVANLAQDLELINKKVGQLTLKMELLETRNQKLTLSLEEYIKQQNNLVREFNALTVSLNTRLQNLESREQVIKREIVAEVSKKIEELAGETQKGLNALAKVIENEPQVQKSATTFDEDYPKTGLAYVVEPGDTLSKIARQFNSTVRDIQNANQIVNPSRDLKVGQTIFIPQRN